MQLVILHLQDALRAEQKGDVAQRANKIRLAQDAFAAITSLLRDLADLRPLIDQLV